jgi:hypothetical protein
MITAYWIKPRPANLLWAKYGYIHADIELPHPPPPPPLLLKHIYFGAIQIYTVLE